VAGSSFNNLDFNQEYPMKIVPYLVTGVALLATSAAFAQSNTATAAVPTTARIYVPITAVLTNTGLDFGDIFANATGGNVVLDPTTDTRTPSGGLVLGTASPFNSAAITVGGKRNAKFSVTLPVSTTLTGAGTAMTVNAFTVATGATVLTPALSKLPNTASATLAIKVGGTLAVGANQMDGDYAGTFNVVVTYN
jgi:hypothetical protein